MSEVALVPILVAGVIVVILGFLWYHPKVFGSAWMRMVNITPEAAEHGKRRMPISVIFALLSAMLAAYVMNWFGLAWGVYDIIGAIELGFWIWAGFVVPAMLGIVLWEQKPLSLYFINAFFWLVAFVAIAITLVVL